MLEVYEVMLVVTGKRKVKSIFRKGCWTERLLLLPADAQRVGSTKPLTSDSAGHDYGVAIAQLTQKMLSGCCCITSFFTFAPTHQLYTRLRACKKGEMKKTKKHKPDEAVKLRRTKHSALRLRCTVGHTWNKHIPEEFSSLLDVPNT